MRMSRSIIFASLLLLPLPVMAQGTGGSAGATASPGALNGSLSNPNPGSQTSPNNLNAAGKPTLPNPPGTNSAGTAQPSGSSAGGGSSSVTTGSAGNRTGGINAQGPNTPGDAAVRAEDPKVDKKIKSICRGC
jgi:hypothetical protein